jgi:hypothetical protein
MLIDKERWRPKKKSRAAPCEPLPHGGFIVGEYLAEKSTEEIKMIYAKELSQPSIWKTTSADIAGKR